MPMQKALETGRQYASEFFAGNSSALWKKMDTEMQKGLKSEEDWATFNKAALSQLGKPTELHNERVMPSMGYEVYTRLFSSEAVAMKLQMTISLSPDGSIAGFFVRPEPNPAPSEYLAYRPKTHLSFPLRGEWTIYQGGRSVYDNYHAAFPDERFAYDIMIIHSDGRMYANDGSKPEDFFAFGQPVVADAAGTIVEAVDRYDDNAVNKPSKDTPKQGNSIVIDHGNGEFSFYAHLQRGSLKVKTGDSVKGGQLLGLVGNTGNSPMIPHLHYHLQTTPNWFKGDGLPTPFQSLVVNGKKVENAEPVRGDVVTAE